MKKEIKDYLPLYLPYGITVFIFPDETIEDGFLDKYRKDYPNGIYNPKLTFDNYSRFLEAGYKPVLRPLSDLKDEDFYSFFTTNDDSLVLIKGKVDRYWAAGWMDKKEYEEKEKEEGSRPPHEILAELEEADFDNVWSCDRLGSIAYGTGDEMRFFVGIEEQSEWINHLRKRGIDCDGLIKAGLAIDKTKIKQTK